MSKILYNVMVKIDYDVYEDWLWWMCWVYILVIMEIGMFIEYWIFCLLGMDEFDGFIYSI